MSHLMLLMLCWIFAAVALAGEVARGESQESDSPALTVMLVAPWFGTPIWLALEGVYYLAVTFFPESMFLTMAL